MEWPHFAVACHWDGEKIVSRCSFNIFGKWFVFGRPSHIMRVQIEDLAFYKPLDEARNHEKN